MDVEADFPAESMRPTRKSGSSGRRDRRRTSAGAIQLRGQEGSLVSPSQGASAGSAGGLEMLHELFGTTLEWGIIDDVFRQCGSSVERATDALLALGSQSAQLPGSTASTEGAAGMSTRLVGVKAM
jgi:hypothetical protein